MNELSAWLGELRRQAGFSLQQLSEKTKILPKHLQSLEAGDFEVLPSPVHARAFALAVAKCCGADDEEALAIVTTAFSHPNAALSAKVSPSPVVEEIPEKKGMAEVDPSSREPSSGIFEGPLPPLPWKLWGMVATGAILFVLLLHGAVSWLRSPKPAAQAAPEPSQAQPQALSPSAEEQGPGEELSLRSRRPCWVVLVLDGKRLPTVLLEPDKREYWRVHEKAVMLAGNIGAVRVWWRGENLGYFGELGERMNGIVFEEGKAWRKDAAEDLPLPPGVPSKTLP
jgi:hypothetical protein